MQWRSVASIVAALALTGCPMEFGKGGFNDRAAHNDTQENVMMVKICSEAWKKEVCRKGGPYWDEKKCEECGGP